MRRSEIDRRSRREILPQSLSDYETEPTERVTMANERAQGTVKFFSDTKGFGFLTRTGGAPDVFFHVRELRRCGVNEEPNQGDVMEFDIEPGENGKGPKGTNFKVISTAG